MKFGLKDSGVKPVASQKKIDKQLSGDLEETIEQAAGEKLQKIKEFEGRLKERWKFEGDSEFYVSICFRDKEECLAFLDNNGIVMHDGRYIFADELPDVLTIKK